MNTADLSITSEQINNLPLLLETLEDLGIRATLDAHVHPHGQWEGASVGTLVEIWLSHLLQERDHTLVSVRDWAADREHTINTLLNLALRPTDCTDDRLANVLTMLGTAETQAALDQDLVQRWLRVYALPRHTVRLDSTSSSVYHELEEPEAATSLLQRGVSKDHRPDLRQFKVMLATLDPLGMPLACQVLAGNRNDDLLYVPAYDRAVEVLGTRAVLVVGDSKMGARHTRGHLVAQGSCYLCAYRPHAATTQLADWIDQALQHRAEWTPITQTNPRSGAVELKSVVYHFTREQYWYDEASKPPQGYTWQERVLIAQSPTVQAGMRRRREESLARVGPALEKLMHPLEHGRRRYATRAALEAKVAKRLAGSELESVIQVELGLTQGVNKRGQAVESWGVTAFWLDLAAWHTLVERLGWQVYLSNTTPEQYEIGPLVLTYRQQAVHERGFSRLKTRNLQIRPTYLRDEQRIAGLVWLLCLALRVLTVLEHRVRTALAAKGEQIVGLNPASHTQATARPTAERLLEAFKNITLTRVAIAGSTLWHVTPLTATQEHVLALLQLPRNPFTGLAGSAADLHLNLRE